MSSCSRRSRSPADSGRPCAVLTITTSLLADGVTKRALHRSDPSETHVVPVGSKKAIGQAVCVAGRRPGALTTGPAQAAPVGACRSAEEPGLLDKLSGHVAAAFAALAKEPLVSVSTRGGAGWIERPMSCASEPR